MFLVLGSLANMIKGLSWMAGGSTRSVFNLSFVRDNNIAGGWLGNGISGWALNWMAGGLTGSMLNRSIAQRGKR